MRKRGLSFLLLISFSSIIFAQNGSISGKIIDAQSQEPLIGASVVLNGTTSGNATNLDGDYSIQNISPGTYTLTVSYISYQTTMKENVVVEADKTTFLTIPLKPADFTLTEMEVVARANRESEHILLMEQRKALIATQAVSARNVQKRA